MSVCANAHLSQHSPFVFRKGHFTSFIEKTFFFLACVVSKELSQKLWSVFGMIMAVRCMIYPA